MRFYNRENKNKIRLEGLKYKAKNFLAAYPGYNIQWLSLGVEDAKDYLNNDAVILNY